MLRDGLTAAARGLALFPIPAGARRPAPGWHHQASTDPARITAVLATGANLGVGCRASNVVGLDLDRHADGPDGIAAFDALCAANGTTWPDTFTVRTPHGGLHLYFHADHRPIPSLSGIRSPLGPGIDIRGPGRRSGGYLLAPGSRIHDHAYTIELDTPIATLPAWLRERLHPCTTRPRLARAHHGTSSGA